MVRVKLDQETLGLSTLMEKITQARVKDCFRDTDTLYFIVATGEMGKALGKGGINVKKMQEATGKRIRVIEFEEQIEHFVANVIYPLKVEEIIVEANSVVLKDSSRKTKSLLIGRESKNLQLINRAVQRFFNVDVKVV